MEFLKKNKKDALQLISVLVPLTFSFLFIILNSYLMLALCIISLFAIVGIMPVFRRYESLWVFILSAAVFLPENLIAVWLFICEDLCGAVINELTGIIVFLALFSLEQIILGVAARILWRRQCRLKLSF